MPDTSNIVPIQPTPPAGPPSVPRRLRHHRLVTRALIQHESRIRESIAVLDLVEEATQRTFESVTFKQWCTICAGVDAARRILKEIPELHDAHELSQEGRQVVSNG
jgi:hypothetical protein